MVSSITPSKTLTQKCISYFWITLGAMLCAVSIRVFLYPNNLIDGGVIGISLIFARLFGDNYLSLYLMLLNIPFIYLAFKHIRRSFVLQMLIAVILFAIFLGVFEKAAPFLGDPLEIIVIGGVVLGIGAGLIIRNGGCLDGTEILAIIINRKKGFTVGQVIMFVNIFIFAAYGIIFKDWHIALRSLMTYFVAFKVMDVVILGLEELKSVMIISTKPKELADLVMNKMGLGLTIVYGRGGYTGEARELLFVIVERLDLADLKDIVLHVDPAAFMAVENLHEVVYGRATKHVKKKAKPRARKANTKASK